MKNQQKTDKTEEIDPIRDSFLKQAAEINRQINEGAPGVYRTLQSVMDAQVKQSQGHLPNGEDSKSAQPTNDMLKAMQTAQESLDAAMKFAQQARDAAQKH